MKNFRLKVIWFLLMLIAGSALLIINLVFGEHNMMVLGFSIGLIAVAAVKLIQYYRISKSPQLQKKYEVGQKEERLITIAEKSGRFAFFLTLLGEFIAILVLIMLGRDTFAGIVAAIVAAQTLVYLGCYVYLSKKI